MSRINLTDTAFDVAVKMSDGNPGALSVITKLLNEGGNIDQDGFMGGMGLVLLLDTFGIYGTDIYILYNDICERDLVKTIAVLRATQMGMFDSKLLQNVCSRQDRSGIKFIPVDELVSEVKEKLPNFAQNGE